MIMSLKSILSQLITNMLLQLKLGFAIKNKTKNKTNTKKSTVYFYKERTVTILHVRRGKSKLFAYAFLGESFSRWKIYRGEYLNQV